MLSQMSAGSATAGRRGEDLIESSQYVASGQTTVRSLVQGSDGLVPAAMGSEQAGFQSSIYNDRNTPVVASLAAGVDRATSTCAPVANLAVAQGNITSGNEVTLTPFRKSGKILRSPKSGELAKAASLTDLRAVVESANKENSRSNSEQIECKLTSLKRGIEGLQEYVKDRHNVHHEIKKMIRQIATCCKGLEIELQEGKSRPYQTFKVPTADKQTQTQTEAQRRPQFGVTAAGSSSAAVTPTTEKRKRDKVDERTGRSPKEKKKRRESNRIMPGEHEASTEMATTPGMDTASEAEEWTEVNRRKVRKKTEMRKAKSNKKPRPEAIIIEKCGELSYADILRTVKNDPNLKELGENVTRIRRSQKGDIVLELTRGTDKKGADYKVKVKNALGDHAAVRTISQESTIECRDLDEITDKQDICMALTNQFGIANVNESAIKSLRKGYGGTQTATISLPVETVNKLLEAGKVKIGWTVCRLREIIHPRSCFKCWEFGHLARECKNDDKSKLCRKCGEEGHFAKNCEREPKCMLCDAVSGVPLKHITGSTRCPAYKSALNLIRK